ncbi:MAG: CDP-alcohol phosphatidyltransferase [Cyanobacteria bacterium RYN_339]|nr:CDP-alcohol phosphatidyltransferase [Cyanobacteria bacterium RYN_339]
MNRLAIPTAVTLANVACGFAALIALATPGDHLALAGWLVVGAWLLDMVDGQVAKLMGATSAFGAQLDSLCDAVSFGAAPALLIATAGGPWGWAAGFAFLAAVLSRLARFNVDAGDDADGHLYFVGLPSPAGGMAIAALALCGRWLGEPPHAIVPVDAGVAHALAGALPVALPLAGLLMAALMISQVRYADLPKHYLKKLAPRAQLLALPVVAALLSPQAALAAFFATYAVAGLVGAWRPRPAAS